MIWIVLVIVFFLLFRSLYIHARNTKRLKAVTSPNRGTKSERKLVLKLLRLGIPPQTIFHDLYVQNKTGRFSQIDIVVPVAAGIIVFEVKDMGGWIFGKGYQSRWTQVLAYGREKYRFYNPVMQNNKHIDDLKKQLPQFRRIPFYSIVVFYGDSVFRDVSAIPDGTLLLKPHRIANVVRMIRNNNPAPYTDKREVVRVLKAAVNNGQDVGIQQQHIDNVRGMFGRDRVFD